MFFVNCQYFLSFPPVDLPETLSENVYGTLVFKGQLISASGDHQTGGKISAAVVSATLLVNLWRLEIFR